VWRKNQEVDILAVLHGLKFKNLSLLAKDVCSAVTGHFTAVIIQNCHIWNPNVPVTILREIRNLQKRTHWRWWREQLQKADKYLSKFKVWNDTDVCEIRGLHSQVKEDSLFQGCYAVSIGRRLRTIRNSVVSPSSGLRRPQRLHVIRPPVNAA